MTKIDDDPGTAWRPWGLAGQSDPETDAAWDHLADRIDSGELDGAVAADFDLDASLQPVDLGPFLDGTARQPVPELLHRDDGKALFYRGSVNGIHGDSGLGKSWVAALAIQQGAAQGHRTMFLDFEDTPVSITARLRLLGLSAHQIATWLVYVRPQVPLGPGAVAHLCDLVRQHNIAHTIIDSVGEAFALEGIDENKDVEVGPWLRRVARPLAETTSAVTLVDHGTKAADNPLYPSGSKRKRAAVTGASYLVEAVDPFVKGRGGRLRLTCAKDRHGNYRRGERVADLVMDSSPISVRLTLYAPSPSTQKDDGVGAVLAARAAVEAARTEGKPLSQNALEGLMKIKAGSTIKRGGMDLAVARGALGESTGPNRTRLLTYVHDLDEDTK